MDLFTYKWQSKSSQKNNDLSEKGEVKLLLFRYPALT